MKLNDLGQPLPIQTEGLGQVGESEGILEPIIHRPGYAAHFPNPPIVSEHMRQIGAAYTTNLDSFEKRPPRPPENFPFNETGLSISLGAFNGSPHMGNS